MPARSVDRRDPAAVPALAIRCGLAFVGAAVLAACTASLVHPGAADAQLAATRWPGTTVAQLEQGRAAYVANCSRCHALHVPEEYPASDWPALVDAMADRAKLGAADREAIVRFLVTTSARLRHEPLPAGAGEGSAAEPHPGDGQ